MKTEAARRSGSRLLSEVTRCTAGKVTDPAGGGVGGGGGDSDWPVEFRGAKPTEQGVSGKRGGSLFPEWQWQEWNGGEVWE